MKLRKTLLVCTAIALMASFIGCNLFNPTESVDIASNDANALTYEGYIKFRNNEYTEAANYFGQAIVADPSHSEAWFGLAKTKMNQQDLNIFELLKYVNVAQKTKFPLVDMDDATAYKYKVGIDTVVSYLKMFIYKDTTGQLDGVITYATISNSFMILQLMQTMLSMRNTTKNMPACVNGSAEGCDLGAILNAMKGNVSETLDALEDVFKTCEENPSTMASIGDQYLAGFDYLKGEAQELAVETMCGALAETISNTGDGYSQEKALNTVISQLGYSDFLDEDGDGCHDEEIYDGQDNDGDGEIDEDLRDKTNQIKYDYEYAARLATANTMQGKKSISNTLIVASAAPSPKYEQVDIDMNLIAGEEDEWRFIYDSYEKRAQNADHRFKFAQKLVFNPAGYPLAEYLSFKSLVAMDNTGDQYDLNFRKTYIGGCWVNYNEEMFKAWTDLARSKK